MRKRYLVTGAAGFIGSNFVKACRKQKIELISVDTPIAFSRFEDRSIFGTIVARDNLRWWLYHNRPNLDAVIHLGACADTTEKDVSYLVRVNSVYSQQLWEYCTYQEIPFIYASSAATYGDGSNGYSDNEYLIKRLLPLNPYGQSKHEFDMWALDSESFGFHPPRWTGFKFFNVYGIGEAHKGKMASIVYQLINQIKDTGSVKLFRSERKDVEDGHQARDFICVQDVIRVLMWAASNHCNITTGIFNLGTGTARTYLDVANITFRCLNQKSCIEFVDMPEELRAQYQYFTEADMSKLQKVYPSLDFFTLEQGIKKYVKDLRKTNAL